MTDYDSIAETLMSGHPSIVGIDWNPFDTRASIRFMGADGETHLKFDQVHYFSTRQTMICRPGSVSFSRDNLEDWEVEHCEILKDSDLIKALKREKFPSMGQVMLHSADGSRPDPVHFVVSAGEGALDIVCETIAATKA